MKVLMNLYKSQIIFWISFIIIPVIMEIIPSVMNFFLLYFKPMHKGKKQLDSMPNITLIVPVYNSEQTLYECIRSIYHSEYAISKISVLCVDNGSKDRSFEVFCKCQQEFIDMELHWITSRQGKSKALNLALFNSDGKYVIHIDSDGLLHKDAINNMVYMFETNKDANCLTGTVLTNPDLVKKESNIFLRLLKESEFYEYCQAFLSGRNAQSSFNSIFTLSGAFSAFRRSTIMETNLYNTDTVCEDTHITFQVRQSLKQRVMLCNDAYFFVDPIESVNQLYTQRQRWQRGELEVIHMFSKKGMRALKGFFSNFVIRLLIYDHTAAFPRMIWYFALICLANQNYSFQLIAISTGLIYGLYVISGLLAYFNILNFLKNDQQIRTFYRKRIYQVLLLPIFNFLVFWFRLAGIINSIHTKQEWRMKNLTEERSVVRKIIKQDVMFISTWCYKIRKFVER